MFLFGYLYLYPFKAEDAALVVAVAGGAGAADDLMASVAKLLGLCVHRLFTAYGERDMYEADVGLRRIGIEGVGPLH